MFCISVFVGILIKDNLLSIIVQIGVSVIAYMGLLLLMKDELVLEGIKKIKKKFLKNQ